MFSRFLILLFLSMAILFFVGCSENYSNGERIGLITQFSNTGIVWKSWEGHLNMTQTGMNSSTPFNFSIDNDKEPADLVSIIDSAARFGWKVKLNYHEVWGMKNVFSNRGETNHFINECEVLDRTPIASVFGEKNKVEPPKPVENDGTINITASEHGRVVDTIYLVIYRDRK